MPEAKDPKRALLTRWIKKRRKVLDGLPGGQWYQGGCNVNMNVKDLSGNHRHMAGNVAKCCNEDVASWFRESKEEMAKALDIIEELLSYKP